MLFLKIIIVIIDTTNDTYNYVKESEFVSDTFAEHDSNEISELRKSLKESLGFKSSENGKSKKNIYISKNIYKIDFHFKPIMIYIILKVIKI